MRKLIASLFAVTLLAATSLVFVPGASASQSRHSCGGVFDTAYYASDHANYDPGEASNACSG